MTDTHFSSVSDTVFHVNMQPSTAKAALVTPIQSVNGNHQPVNFQEIWDWTAHHKKHDLQPRRRRTASQVCWSGSTQLFQNRAAVFTLVSIFASHSIVIRKFVRACVAQFWAAWVPTELAPPGTHFKMAGPSYWPCSSPSRKTTGRWTSGATRC
jgi:hypothetical protein